MSRPPLDSTPVGMKMSDTKILPLDSTTVCAKTSDPKTLTLQKESSELKEKAQKYYVPEDPDSEPSSSDSSSNKSDLCDERI